MPDVKSALRVATLFCHCPCVQREEMRVRLPLIASALAYLLRFLAIAVGAALLPAGAQAACTWDVGGDWVFLQTNGYEVKFNLHQNGSELRGTATQALVTPQCRKTSTCPTNTVSADGSIQGDVFEVVAYWSAENIGVYRGRVGQQGRIEGDTFDKRHPESTALWHSDRTAKCGTSQPIEHDTDRPGSDIRTIEVAAGDIYACQAACQSEPACRAWTYVKPGIQGRAAKCWLKNGVPGPRQNTCCVSGIR